LREQENLQGASSAIELLGGSLSFGLSPGALTALCLRLFGETGVWDRLIGLAVESGLAEALYERLEVRGLMPPQRNGKAEASSPAAVLLRLYEQNDVRRTGAPAASLGSAASAPCPSITR